LNGWCQIKTLNIDYNLYQEELSEAAIAGANLSVELIGAIERYLHIIDSARTQNDYYHARKELIQVLTNLKTYGKSKLK
jgi:hypothetical protein